MKNGSEFTAFIEKTTALLSGKRVIDYYQEPLPGEMDAALDEVIGRYMTAESEQRRRFLEALTQSQRSLFGIYGHRAATLSVRREEPKRLLRGLVGAAIANYEVPARRNVDVALAVYHHCARKLGMGPVDLFEETAVYAEGDIALYLIRFGKRNDVVLKQFGWRELKTPDGVQYKFEW